MRTFFTALALSTALASTASAGFMSVSLPDLVFPEPSAPTEPTFPVARPDGR